MVEYVMPDKDKKRIQDGYHKLLIAKSIQKKLALTGVINPEAEIKLEELLSQARLNAQVWDITLEEE